VHAILDAGLMCCIAAIRDARPVATPTIYWRKGEKIYWHGAAGGASAGGAADVCLTVALLDGLVLARSALRHSVQYRSVMVFGRARQVMDDQEKLGALEGLFERLYPGRWPKVRPPSLSELAATAVAALDIEEVSAKVRGEGPVDLEQDLGLPVWAGVIPVALTTGAPVPQDGTAADGAPVARVT
jgi:hypothetical protein